MSTAAVVLGCTVAVLATFVACALIRACADVRIAAHTGIDPRVDREAAKRSSAPGPNTVNRIEQRGHPNGGPKD